MKRLSAGGRGRGQHVPAYSARRIHRAFVPEALLARRLQAPAVALNQAILAAIPGGLQTLFDCHFAPVCGFVFSRKTLRNLLI